MKKLFTILVILTTLNGFSQNFAPPGATWYYSYSQFQSTGFAKLSYAGDTTIQGIEAQKILKTLTFTDLITGVIHSDINQGFEFTYADEDHVYQFIENDLMDNGFRVLYDFTVQVGDTVLVYNNNNDYFDATECDTVGRAVVTETGIDIINNLELRWYKVQDIETSAYSFSGKIIEQIGNATNYMFSSPICIVLEELRSPFRCYSDDSFQEYKNPVYEGECDFVTGISEIPKADLGLQVIPNPANEMANITVSENVQVEMIRVLELTGKSVLEKQVSGSTMALDISALSPGMYLLEVETKDGLREVKRVVIK